MTLLQVDNLHKTFGNAVVLQDLSFAIAPGTVHSIIGPNGAGKTTLFNVISGLYRPTQGRIRFDGRDITGLPAHALAPLGLSRTFQNLQIFLNMSAIDNVCVGYHLSCDGRFLASLLRFASVVRADRDYRERAVRLMQFVGLDAYVGADASAMPYGALKRLEIARALAVQPKMLLLDEPAAGLNPKETAALDELILSVAARGVTVVLVEHDMRLVWAVSNHILVLDGGRKLAEGTGPEKFAATPTSSPPIWARRGAIARSLLEVAQLDAGYGPVQTLWKVSVHINAGELVTLVGGNGTGKTTLLRTLSGLLPAKSGTIRFEDRDVTRMPAHARVRLGITQVPEGRQVLAPMSVEENLRLGGYTRNRREIAEGLEKAYALFPGLRARRGDAAGLLSGGQQQMLAIARALMARPRILLLDEPSMGLSPLLVDEVFATVERLRDAGTTIFLVEQNAYRALSIADRGYVLEAGRIILADDAAVLMSNRRVKEAYLGL